MAEDLNGENVSHIRFGHGTIKKAEGQYITIVFDAGSLVKTFQYPQAFEHFIKVDDAKAEKQIRSDLKKAKELQKEEAQEENKNIVDAIERVSAAKRLAEEKKMTRSRKTKRSTKSANKTEKKTAEAVK